MATLREKRGGLMSAGPPLLLLLLLFGGLAFSEDVGNGGGGLEGPKTAAVQSSAVATVPRPPPRQRPPLPSSSGLKMQLTANPRTKDHRNGKSEYILPWGLRSLRILTRQKLSLLLTISCLDYPPENPLFLVELHCNVWTKIMVKPNNNLTCVVFLPR